MIQLVSLSDVPEYYHRYIQYITGGNYFALMAENMDAIEESFLAYADRPNYAYAEGKWTVLQVLSHLIDVERVMGYRLHAISRSEQQGMLGFDHDAYVQDTDVKNKTISGLLKEMKAVRMATIAMIGNLSQEELKRKGVANKVTFSAEGIAWIMLGHCIHHVKVLKELYVD